MRSRFRRGERVFAVDLIVHQLDSIPEIHRLLYVHWRARRGVPAEGRTPSLAVEPGNVVRWNAHIHFTIAIPADPADPTILQPAPLVLQLRSERRGRWLGTTSYQAEGTVEVDLSDAAAVGVVARNFLVQESLLNTTLKLTIRVTHQSGDKIFRTRALAAPSVSSTHDDTGPDDDSAGTLPPLPRDASLLENMAAEARVERTASVPLDRQTPALPISGAMSGRLGAASVSVSTPLLPSMEGTESTTGPLVFPNADSPSTVLENSIPNPEVVQRRVYEKMFQAQVRDEWPAHVVASRVDATEAVNEIYASVCAADGIGVAASGANAAAGSEALKQDISELPKPDKTLSVELLIESRKTVVPPGGSGQARIPRKNSGRSPHLSVRSSSMDEITNLAKLSS